VIDAYYVLSFSLILNNSCFANKVLKELINIKWELFCFQPLFSNFKMLVTKRPVLL